MNGRQTLRKYAQSKGKDATSFVKVEETQYENDVLVTKDSNDQLERTTLDYKELFHFIVRHV